MKTILSAMVGATLAFAAIEAAAQATPGERQVALTIETDTLASALDKWAQQSGFQIFVQDWEAAKSLRAPSLKGTFAAQDALEQLLSGTPLTYAWISDKAVSIRKKMPKTLPTALQGTGLDGQQSVHVAKFSGDDVDGGAANYAAAESSDSAGDKEASLRVQSVEEIVVTGTYIRGVPPDSSPLTVYDREEIVRSGVGTVDQFLRKIPQNFAIVDAGTSEGNLNNAESGKNMSRGTAINLRGLGAGATLTLLNGHRLAPSGLDGSFVDVSMIPLSAIDRIEVLTDGASALYGADAVAGVVNFILRDDLSGGETSLRYGDTTQGGGSERAFTQLFGGTWSSGNAMFLYENYDVESIRAADRDFINQAGGADTVLPDQDRQTFLFSGRQHLGERTSLFGDASYSERDYVFDAAGLTPTHNTGGSEQYVAAVGLTQDLGSAWQAEIVGNYARNEDNQTTSFPGSDIPPGQFEVEARLMSADARADGPIFEAWGGTARFSAGIGARKEEFDDNNRAIPSAGVGLERTARSAYAEIYLPLIGTKNSGRFAQRLEFSLAGRYDDYEDMGSSVDPKVGVLWSPAGGLNLRATYAESYRVPPLAQLSPLNKVYLVDPFSDAQSPTGTSNTLVLFAPGNPNLRPERSRSISVGLDFRPQDSADRALSVNYFKVEYSGRIANPPAVGIDFLVPELARFTNRSPDLAEIERIFAEELVINPSGLAPGDVQVTFDNSLQNIAKSTVEGFDLSANLGLDLPVGRASLFFSGEYLLKLEHRPASTVAPITAVDTIFNPCDLRLRGGASWTIGNFDSTLSVNYVDDYKNNIIDPAGTVSSWTTVDLQLSYRAPEGGPWLFSGLTLALNVQNLADSDPPSFEAPNELGFLGYDPTNASPRGRFISAVLTKRW